MTPDLNTHINGTRANAIEQPERIHAIEQPARIHVAPMMGYTDKYLRALLRYLSPHSWLYTEMICAPAIVNGQPQKLLDHQTSENPLVLQIGGGDPEQLHRAAKIAAECGYLHLNLNAGCPSDKVGQAGIGACLLKDIDRLADCTQALQVPGIKTTSVKTRIGVDELDSAERLFTVCDRIQQAGCHFLILHARKVLLNGLSPKQNRTIPPLNYPLVYRLQNAYKSFPIILNGGLKTYSQCLESLEKCHGVMLGRAIIRNPLLLMEIERQIWATAPKSLAEILSYYFDYLARSNFALKHHSLRHIMTLFKGMPGVAKLRQNLITEKGFRERALLCQRYASLQDSLVATITS